MRNYCFDIGQRCAPASLPDLVRPKLDGDHAAALAALLPLLGCGEEAAALAFDGLANARQAEPAVGVALRTIANEERVHDALMRQLGDALPPVPRHATTLSAAKRFHINLAQGGVMFHLARIAALDAAVCTVLSRLLGAEPLSADRTICAILARVRRDEARHVAVSRMLVGGARHTRALRDAAAAARGALASILMLEAQSFDRLGVDADALHRDISRLPDGLLPA